MTYDIAEYGGMIADRTRMDAYDNALGAAIRPDSVVVDIGTGTGILALLACRHGARHVYAIEPDSIILLARSLARANGFEDRITFIQDISTNVELPAQVDVIVSDLHGVLPYHDQHLPTIVDARTRFLHAGGTLIPRGEEVFGALVEAPELHANLSEPWRSGGFGLCLEPGLKHALNSVMRTRFKGERALSVPVCLDTLDYYTITSPNLETQSTFIAGRDGTAHGVAMWFDVELAQGVRFNTNPWDSSTVYGAAFLPFLEPITLKAGESLAVRLRAELYGCAYVWAWGAEKQTDSESRTGDYTQSTLLQSLPPLASLLGGSP